MRRPFCSIVCVRVYSGGHRVEIGVTRFLRRRCGELIKRPPPICDKRVTQRREDGPQEEEAVQALVLVSFFLHCPRRCATTKATTVTTVIRGQSAVLRNRIFRSRDVTYAQSRVKQERERERKKTGVARHGDNSHAQNVAVMMHVRENSRNNEAFGSDWQRREINTRFPLRDFLACVRERAQLFRRLNSY